MLVGVPAAPQETGALLQILAAMAARGGAIRLAACAKIAREALVRFAASFCLYYTKSTSLPSRFLCK